MYCLAFLCCLATPSRFFLQSCHQLLIKFILDFSFCFQPPLPSFCPSTSSQLFRLVSFQLHTHLLNLVATLRCILRQGLEISVYFYILLLKFHCNLKFKKNSIIKVIQFDQETFLNTISYYSCILGFVLIA